MTAAFLSDHYDSKVNSGTNKARINQIYALLSQMSQTNDPGDYEIEYKVMDGVIQNIQSKTTTRGINAKSLSKQSSVNEIVTALNIANKEVLIPDWHGTTTLWWHVSWAGELCDFGVTKKQNHK